MHYTIFYEKKHFPAHVKALTSIYSRSRYHFLTYFEGITQNQLNVTFFLFYYSHISVERHKKKGSALFAMRRENNANNCINKTEFYTCNVTHIDKANRV